MSRFVPENDHLRHAMLYDFHLKRSAAESHRLLIEAYGEHAPSVRTCDYWFARFKSGDFDLKNKERGKPPKKFEDAELQALLDQDSTQTERQLAEALNVTRACVSRRLHALGKIQKEGKWVPHELSERDIERRKIICEILLRRHKRKSFLPRIVTGDEKWVYFDNPKRKKSWVDPGQPSTSQPVRNIHGKKALLCIWWDMKGPVYYELLQPGQTVTGERYRQQLDDLSRELHDKRPEWARKRNKVILLHDNARPHVAKVVQEKLEELNWEVLPHAAYSPDLAPSDYHLFRSMQHGLSEQHFSTFEEVKNWIDEWLASKDENFYERGIRLLPQKWEKVIENDGQYFDY